MYKGLLHIAFSLLVLLNGMSYSIIQGQFYLQRDRIAELFCINQDKPELQCDGKCELSKRLNEAKEKEESPKAIVLKELNLIFTLPESVNFNENSGIASNSKHSEAHFLPKLPIRDFDFFHPPRI
ncbi:hypothetical protein [Algoriphagus sp. CAU 1675]|uniref:hypothetical protein n=1 Tax=Algoriphagus sp. CAU 1675 TaxID=3032597 RepID=UPI0023DC40C0|nr:hypothetical protein [Algoriphagus sp. CAU 1675]MDF2158263.1 hypothetical protein [Algoriphagus sp. CAU 1675]